MQPLVTPLWVWTPQQGQWAGSSPGAKGGFCFSCAAGSPSSIMDQGQHRPHAVLALLPAALPEGAHGTWVTSRESPGKWPGCWGTQWRCRGRGPWLLQRHYILAQVHWGGCSWTSPRGGGGFQGTGGSRAGDCWHEDDCQGQDVVQHPAVLLCDLHCLSYRGGLLLLCHQPPLKDAICLP